MQIIRDRFIILTNKFCLGALLILINGAFFMIASDVGARELLLAILPD